MTENRKLKVFLCHSKDDKPKVRELYHRLIADGFDAWLDEERLMPGQDWDLEIRKAVRESNAVLVCLSNNSVTKAGYVQKEIHFALDIADEQPDGSIFIIPVRIEDCLVPTRLSKWQWVDLFEDGEYEKLLGSLERHNIQSIVATEDVPKVNRAQIIEEKLDRLISSSRSQTKKQDRPPIIQVSIPGSVKRKSKKLRDSNLRRVRLLLTWVSLIGLFYLIALLVYVYPHTESILHIPPNVGVTFRAPKYLSVGDKNLIEVTIINQDEKEPLNGTITLVFSDLAVPFVTTSAQGMSIVVDNLPPKGRVTETLTIKLSSKRGLKEFEYYFQLSRPDKTQSISEKEKFLIAPISSLRSQLPQITTIVSSVALIGLLLDYFWNKLKDLIGQA